VCGLSVQEDICETIYASLERCCPALYLERAPLSVLDLRAGLPVSKVHIYHPRTIIMAQLAGVSSVSRDPGSGSQAEQLADLVVFGSDELWSCLSPGVDQHVTGLSLYARYRLCELLDHKDWNKLSKALGIEVSEADEDISKAPVAVYSMTDRILSDWVHNTGPAATIRALNNAMQTLQRSDVVEALLTLTPLYRYVNNDNNNDPHHDFLLQGRGKGRQRPVSMIKIGEKSPRSNVFDHKQSEA